jgi:SH3-like domain-containing protein
MKRLFAILALGLCASASAADAVTVCDIKVFPIDPDPKGSNIRSGPAGDTKVLGVIASDESELMVTGSMGKWLRINRAEGMDGTAFFEGEGWVFAALTGITARSATKLHASPDPASPVVGSMAADEQGTMQACSGKWVQVQTKKAKGWLAPYTHCGNPVTTCV